MKIERFNDGQIVRPSSTNPDFSVIRVSESTMSFSNGFPVEHKKTAIIRGKNALIAAIVDNPALLDNAHIQVVEKRESEVTANDLYVPANSTFQEQLDRFAKRAGNNGPVMTIAGERIIRYTKVTSNVADTDITVAHDNVDEVKAHAAAQRANAANTIPTA